MTRVNTRWCRQMITSEEMGFRMIKTSSNSFSGHQQLTWLYGFVNVVQRTLPHLYVIGQFLISWLNTAVIKKLRSKKAYHEAESSFWYLMCNARDGFQYYYYHSYCADNIWSRISSFTKYQNIKISLLPSRPSGFTLVLVASPMTRATLAGAGTGSPLRALIDKICSLIKYFSLVKMNFSPDQIFLRPCSENLVQFGGASLVTGRCSLYIDAVKLCW